MTAKATDKLPPTDTGRCGEYAGYRRHRHRGQHPCTPCAQAAADYDRARRAHTRKPRPPKPQPVEEDPKPTPDEIRATEIEFLLGCGEGEHAIAKALGVKPDSLRRQLHRDGNAHLIPQVFAYAEERRQQGNR